MRFLTRKDGELSSYFDKVGEKNFNGTTMKKILIKNRTNQANEGKVLGQLPLE